MKSRDSLIRLHRFQVDEMRRNLASLEAMKAEFVSKADELDRQVQAEQERAGISDVGHFAYPTFAKAALQRKENLLRSIEEIDKQIADARGQLSDAFQELKKHEILEDTKQKREKAARAQRSQKELDEIALAMHQRKEMDFL